MKKMMQRMGVKMDEIPAEEVIIRGLDNEIRITEPQVIRT
ncbi:MAG: NAC domain-containing protein, partial [Candidatus Altiarchaeota archaeon]